MRKILLLAFIAFTGCDLITQSESKPVVVNAPPSAPTNFHDEDSSFLKIHRRENNFEVELLKKVSLLNDINALDSFFQKNIADINKNKVVVIGFDTIRRDESLMGVLEKHGVYKFRVAYEDSL